MTRIRLLGRAFIPPKPSSTYSRAIPLVTRRNVSTDSVHPNGQPPITAAPPIDLSSLPEPSETYARVVPNSPSYFTAEPHFTDDLINVSSLLRRHALLPTVPPLAAPRVVWQRLSEYCRSVAEPVRSGKYSKIVAILKQLNRIHPVLMPPEVKDAIEAHRRVAGRVLRAPNPPTLDELGRSYGLGRRKTSSARAWLVEGQGEVLINGKPLPEIFGRLHDRESAIWALKATGRVDKYNVWARVDEGGTTGQAEAVTLAVAKALLVHEPALKPALRRGE